MKCKNKQIETGFTTAKTPWLPVNTFDLNHNVEALRNQTSSLWTSISLVNRLKRDSLSLTRGDVAFLIVDADILSFAR